MEGPMTKKVSWHRRGKWDDQAEALIQEVT